MGNSIKTAIAACTMMIVLAGPVVAANAYDDGMAAYRSGDYVTAWKLLRALADSGDAAAQYNFGSMYAEGRGVVKNDTEALKWFRRAAEQGYSDAQNNLGLRYAGGHGVQKDDAEAVKWYRAAAERGHADAEFNLGLAYADGKSVQKDFAEAANWWHRAADFGHPGAQYNLGVLYADGQGVMKDLKAAMDWYLRAAEQGHVGALNNLGAIFAAGIDGMPPDLVQAHKWFALAASRTAASEKESSDLAIKESHDTALRNRLLIAAKMTPEQIAEAQKLARDWATGHTKMFCYYFATVANGTGYCDK